MRAIFVLCLITLSAFGESPTFVTKHGKRHATGLIRKHIFSSERTSYLCENVVVPNQLDLRPKISQIEDQGNCGSCWAHSLTQTARWAYSFAGKDPGALSPQYLVDCALNADGCNGGYFDAAMYMVAPKGAPTTLSYPYQAKNGYCDTREAPAAHILSYHMLGTDDGPATLDIEAYMTKTGRIVSATVAAGAGPWQDYAAGIYNKCVMANPDHMINIVGWDNEGGKFDRSGNLPRGVGYWILMNSWGKSWGEQGFMRIRMTDPKGQKCNNVANEAASFDFDFEPTQVKRVIPGIGFSRKRVAFYAIGFFLGTVLFIMLSSAIIAVFGPESRD